MYALKKLNLLRVTVEGEVEGLDIHEHGAPAYHPEPAYNVYSVMPPGYGGVRSAPGMPAESVLVET